MSCPAFRALAVRNQGQLQKRLNAWIVESGRHRRTHADDEPFWGCADCRDTGGDWFEDFADDHPCIVANGRIWLGLDLARICSPGVVRYFLAARTFAPFTVELTPAGALAAGSSITVVNLLSAMTVDLGQPLDRRTRAGACLALLARVGPLPVPDPDFYIRMEMGSLDTSLDAVYGEAVRRQRE